jgi:hypothetical protein
MVIAGLDHEATGRRRQVPVDFHHPYTPYSIQEDFMRTVYEVLQDGKVGILESPTGTVCFSAFCRSCFMASSNQCLGLEVSIQYRPTLSKLIDFLNNLRHCFIPAFSLMTSLSIT